MKRTIAIFALWFLALCFMLYGAFAQTNTNVITVATTSTNAPIVVVPLNDRIREWTDAAQNFALGVGAVLLTIAGIWINLKTKLATLMTDKAQESDAISKVLIQEIEKTGSREIKANVASSARDMGVGDALHDLVKENTPSATPVANPPTPTETKPI